MKQGPRYERWQKQETKQILEISGINLKITLHTMFKEVKDKDEISSKEQEINSGKS